jgi:hypothetical protein
MNTDSGLLAVMGHAIYKKGKWHGGYAGEEPFYEEHIRAGIRLFLEQNFEQLAFCGGRTRANLEPLTGGISEAEGMLEFAVENRIWDPLDDRLILENYSRDSFENLLFALLGFRQKTGHWPARVGVVSWNSKGLRFHLIASGLRLGGRIFFHGSGDYPNPVHLERASAAEARLNAAMIDLACEPPNYRLIDPLFRKEEFANKRLKRMPSQFTPDPLGNTKYLQEVRRAFAGALTDSPNLLEQIETIRPGDEWKKIHWPWAK